MRIPPARSPLALRSVMRALPRVVGLGSDARPALTALLRDRYCADDVALLGSGTDALRLALELAAARTPRGTVLLPAYSCYEVATAAVGARVPVAFYDIDPDTLEPDWSSLRARAQGEIAALVIAPLYGSILDWDEARRVADGLGAPLIEDAAQAHGATWRERPVGALGDLSVLSFGRGKGWSGAGGGALLRRGEWATPALWPVLHQARSRELWTAAAAGAQIALSDPRLYSLPASLPFLRLGETIYHEPVAPRAMTSVSARLVMDGVRRSDAEAALRTRHAQEYQAALAPTGMTTGQWQDARGRAGAIRFPIRLRGGWAAAAGGELARLGVGPAYPMPLAELPALTAQLRAGGRFRGAEALVAELVTLPTHARTTERSRRRLMDLLISPETVAHVQHSGLEAGLAARSVSVGH